MVSSMGNIYVTAVMEWIVKFPIHSPGGAMFDIVVVYNRSNLLTRDISNDNMWSAAIGWRPL